MPLREPVGLVEVLGRQEHGRTFGRDAAHEVPHLRAAARVEAGGGLVEEQDLRDRHEARGDVDAAPLASRVGLDLPAGGLREPECLEQLRRARRLAPRQTDPSSRPTRTRFS